MESVSFKAYLKRDGQEVEVRRFGIDGGAATNYLYLRGKIQAIFPSVQNDHFNVFWQDQDKDYITISSDEELMEALTAGQQMLPIKLYIHVNAQRQTQGSVPKQTHSGVVCDACEGPVSGYRYKCVTCPDYDLCATCEAAGLHQEHFMLRMPTPIPASCHPKFFRKLLRHPHKFHKKHSWNRVGEMMGQGLGAHESCPFTQRSRPTTAGGVVDMFDFTALMEFINSLGVATGGESAANEPTVGAQGFSEAQASAPGPQPSAKGPQPAASGPQQTDSQRQPGPKANEYLTGIGHAIAAFLDPFGVDVTFDVRSKQNEAQDAAASSSSQNTPLFTPTTSQSTPLFKPNTTQNTTLFTPTTLQNTTLITPTTSNKNDTLITPTIDNNIPSAAPATQPNPTQIVIPITTSQAEPAVPNSTSARRNSDDWTLLNRESPNRFDAEVTAMDVEEPRGARPKVYPELPSAPTPPSVPLDSEQERIQRATDSIRSMGFNFPPALLAELLRKENCDIAKVLEVILTTGKK